MKCLNCGTEFDSPYCPNCGQSAKTGPLKIMPAIKDLIPIIYNFDTRFMRTCVQLFSRPGHMIREYVDGRRVPYFNPLSLLFVLATIYFVFFQLLFGHAPGITGSEPDNISGLEEKLAESPLLLRITQSLFQLLHNKAWAAIFGLPFNVLALKIIFLRNKARTYTIADYFYLMIFIQCQSLLLEILIIPIEFLGIDVLYWIIWVSTFAFFIIALKQSHSISWGKSIGCYILYYILSNLIMIGTGVLLFFLGRLCLLW